MILPPPSVAVRENAEGAPTVVSMHTDRPNRPDARPLYVRGQRNITVYSTTR